MDILAYPETRTNQLVPADENSNRQQSAKYNLLIGDWFYGILSTNWEMLSAAAIGAGGAIMSLRLFDQLTYSEEDRQIMEIAHIKACELLDQPPAYNNHNDRLARTIVKLFDQGTRDYQIPGAITAHREAVMVRRTSTHHFSVNPTRSAVVFEMHEGQIIRKGLVPNESDYCGRRAWHLSRLRVKPTSSLRRRHGRHRLES